QYLERRTIAQIQGELISSKQKSDEDVLSFANRIERLSLDLTDACIASEGATASKTIKSLNEKCALRTFVEGLQNPIKLIVKTGRFQTFQEAVTAACEEERNNKLPHSNFQSSLSAQLKCYFCHKSGHKAAQCYLRKNSVHFPNKFPYKSTHNINQVQLFCNYCKNVGHSIEHC